MRDSMRDRFTTVALDIAESDERTVIVTAVIGRSRFQEMGSDRIGDRCIDVGIREQAQIGVAGGLALEGFMPIVTGYAPFLVERPFEQIKLSLTHQGVHAILVSLGASWDSSGDGRTHQAPEDVALMSTLPGWTVHVPGHPHEVELLLRDAHAVGGSVYIRTSTGENERAHLGDPGKIVTLRRGAQGAITVVVVGPLADDVLEATTDLDATILYTATPKPIDARGIHASVLGTDVVVVEPYLAGTSSAQIVAALSDRPMRFHSIGVTQPDLRRYGTPCELKAAHSLDAVGIRRQILSLCDPSAA
jgi:transketolase